MERAATGVPAVSVIIPAYNAAAHIGAALDSVFAQTFTDYEVLVINDGSPDTPELERALDAYAGRLLYVRQENRGPSGARNAGITRARGEYVALLDSDDLWLPAYLAEQMKALRAEPALDLIYADAELFGDSDLAGRTFMETAPSRGRVSFESLARWECTVITSCTVARRRALIDAGLFDEEFNRSEDFHLWLRLAHRGGRLAYQRRVLARHRVHGASLAADRRLMVEGQIAVFRRTARTLALTPAERELIETQIASCHAHLLLEEGVRRFVAGDYAQAIEQIARANEFFRSPRLRVGLLGLHVAPRLLQRIYLMRQRTATRRRAPSAPAAKSDVQIPV
jgi:glycosyltransferase involved in cell wall biosynthesis